MKRSHSQAATDASQKTAGFASTAQPRELGLLSEDDLTEIESTHSNGLTSRQIVDLFESRGIRFSEATLRKYVQLGLLPRSVRVGRKGKHRGSCGLYPAQVVRRVNLVKKMMAEDMTIEDIQRSFVSFKESIEGIEKGVQELFASIEREFVSRDRETAARGTPDKRRDLAGEIEAARVAAGELIRRIGQLEKKLLAREGETRDATVGGGSHLF